MNWSDENAHAPGDCPPMPTPWIILAAADTCGLSIDYLLGRS